MLPIHKATPIEALKHGDKRVNIPTEELREFVAEDEKSPKTVLYPRDPSLDPQLVWKGKDEQDREDLAVPAVPIYIQEKIHPRAIIEDLRAQARKERPAPQMDLFADFNGIEWEELVEFYQHEQSWSNRIILGDSLLVMNSLAEKEGLKGQVQMIYMDPPYGIKFGSNWQVSTRKRDVKDGSVADVTRQPEQVRAFRDTWKLGIHSYLAYLRDRLVVARELLTDSASIFVQIGDENVHLVRSLLDEVFGSENMVSLITIVKTSAQEDLLLPSVCDYLLWYAKNKQAVKYRPVWITKLTQDPGANDYNRIHLPDTTRRRLTRDEEANWELLPDGVRVYGQHSLVSQRPPGDFPVAFEGEIFRPLSGFWKTGTEGMKRLLAAQRVERRGRTLRFVRFYDDFPVRPAANFWVDTRFSSRAEDKVYVVQTTMKVVERCLLMTTDPGDLVLDPTCGSGTTAFVAEQWGRRWITTDTSRVALTLARTRLMAGRFPYYVLVDSHEYYSKVAEIEGKIFDRGMLEPGHDVKRGFYYRKVPHVTLKSIANNEEIDAIHARWQEKLEPLRARLNQLLKQRWEEWEIPREPGPKWLPDAREVLGQWWDLRRQRQQEIDASIARRADTEVLYDQPYEDPKRIRVTGPFTVESLSPHRVLDVEEKVARSQGASEALPPGRTVKVLGPDTFGHTIIDNLRKAGVQNTKKSERLKFDSLEPFAGEWIQAAGEYTERDGKVRRAAVALGPEYGTVGPELVKEAAKEAVKGAGFDLLIVCGFAFDAHAGETAKEFSPGESRGSEGFAVAEGSRQFGKLPVLLARMNPDLAMGDELLKKTGAGNLFTVFGEPDLSVERTPDGKVVLEIRGLDVFDPTTGEIRSSSTDDIACWFVDTDYDEESFFVRHAYFTGADEPYEKLQRALRAEIDEAAWASLYSTRSRPFDPPTTGKVAVKVINHYGDEVLKVFGIT